MDEAAHRLDQAKTLLLNIIEDKLLHARQRLDIGARMAYLVEGKLLKGRFQIQGCAVNLQQKTTLRLADNKDRLGDFRSRLHTGAITVLLQGEQVLNNFPSRLERAAGLEVRYDQRRLALLAETLSLKSIHLVKNKNQQLEVLTGKARLLDPARLLARGYSLTRTNDGTVIKSISEVAAGQKIITRFHDGEVTSIVQPGKSEMRKNSNKGNKNGSKSKANSGQKTLFR